MLELYDHIFVEPSHGDVKRDSDPDFFAAGSKLCLPVVPTSRWTETLARSEWPLKVGVEVVWRNVLLLPLGKRQQHLLWRHGKSRMRP